MGRLNFMPPRIYLDANVFIISVEGGGEVTERLHELLALIENGAAQACTSDLTIAELLVAPYRNGDEALASTYLDMVSANEALRLAPVDRDTLISAARLRSRDATLKLPDAIHIASAERCDCGVFLSCDQRVRVRAPMQRVGLALDELDELVAFLS